MKKRQLLLEPRESAAMPGIEFSLHMAPKNFRACDVETVFPDAKHYPHLPLMVLVTFQSTKECVYEYTADAAEFKDESRDAFFEFCALVRSRLLDAAASSAGDAGAGLVTDRISNAGEGSTAHISGGWWMDWSDPATGLPLLGNAGSTAFCESDGVETLLSYEVVHVGTIAGGCRMISHPRHGLDVYPSSAFICAPPQVVLEVLRAL